MGLFDFLRKRKLDQSSSKSKVVGFHSHATKQAMPEPAVLKNEIVAKTPFLEFSSEQEAPPLLDSLLRDATPSKQGLYPHEILMLAYAPRYKTANNSFQHFWYWQYSVTNPQAVLDSLLERGFTNIEDLRSTLEKLTLPQIKEELKKLNQKVSGKKVELIDRLMEFGNLDALNLKYSERYYSLTSKGKQELEENPYVPYLHRNRYMTVWEMNRRIAQTHYPFRDILWGYFNEQSEIHFRNFDFGLYRNTRLSMYQFLLEENKPKTAFHMLCEVLSFDLSGLGNNEKDLFEWKKSDPQSYLMIFESRIECFFPYENTSLIISPFVSKGFTEMQIAFGLDDTEYRDAILKELQESHPPRRIFSDEECADIIIAYIRNDNATLVALFSQAEKREKEKLKNIKAPLLRQNNS